MADVVPNPLFNHHAVLQQGTRVPVWGEAAPGERVTVAIAGQKASAKADAAGRWRINLDPIQAGGPYTLAISGKNRLEFTNVLVGEVWLCSGQSNMERHLGLQPGQKPIIGWEQAVATANLPQMRQFYVPQKTATSPQKTVAGTWSVCSPETAGDFTAVGFYFGRDLLKSEGVPVGLIHSSWGGTVAEAWTSEETLSTMDDFKQPLAEFKRLIADPDASARESQSKLDAWFASKDPGSAASPPWSDAALGTASWKTLTLPAYWEKAGYADYDGVFWFRRAFLLPDNWDGGDAVIHLGAIDDNESTWVNGRQVGATTGWDVPRVYRVPASALQKGTNVIAVRVFDLGMLGGLYGPDEAMRLEFGAANGTNAIPLKGEWLCRQGASLATMGWPPATDLLKSPNTPTVLYNGMIAPLLPYSIRGAIWYQGESNVGRERQYQTLFPAMIADWRRAWGENLPFLFVQIAPYKGMTPEIREAQLLSWRRTPRTAMAVTIDCGDADDIHPADKQPVGARLALAARAVAYGEKIEYSGPVFDSMTVEGATAVLRFTHAGGLMARDGDLKGFTIAGVDKVFHPAQAAIQGDTVVVRAEGVSQPVAVRYGWANVPEGNLFNASGLPASPFRTDAD